METTVSISIRPNGTIETIFDKQASSLYESLGAVTKQRVSNVLPVGRWRRRVFRFIRSRVADGSLLAGLCRRIPGSWSAHMVSGEVLGPYRHRHEAIEAEVALLHSRGL